MRSVRGRICDWVGILVVFHICDADFYLDFDWFIFVMGWWKIMGIDNQIDTIFYNFQMLNRMLNLVNRLLTMRKNLHIAE